MKKLFKRVFGIAASAALLVTSSMTAFAADPGHNHHSEDKNIASPTDGYTITLTTPSGYVTPENQSSKKFGAYQIFTGTVKGGETIKDPGDTYKEIPITDIKWGNAFGADDTAAKQNIIKFVFALAEAPTGYYKYAFSEFTGFEDFVKDGKLSTEYLNNLATEIKVGKGEGSAISGKSEVTGNIKDVNFDKLAVKVSDVIADNHNNREWLQSFTDILGGYGKDYQEGNFVSQCYGKENNLAPDGETYKYEIKVPAGYYMIMDLSTIDYDAGTDNSDAYSARMLFVANDITQKIKESVPTLDKKVLRADDAVGTAGKETDVAGVGDVVHFQLKGTLPSNYDNYLGGYKYIFEDTLSDGLDLVQYDTHNAYVDGSGTYVNVTVKGLFVWNVDKWEWKADATATIPVKVDSSILSTGSSSTDVHLKDSDNYNVAYASQKLTVAFPCLREIRVKGDGEFASNVCRLGYNTATATSSEIYVDYYAKVNKDAVVSPKDGENDNGNFNTAQIQYSDNPQSYGDTDYTTTDRATVYTFGLDITKVDAADFLKNDSNTKEPNKSGLAGAQFVMLRRKGTSEDGYQWQIAKFKWIEATTAENNGTVPKSFKTNGYNTIFEWVDITGAKAADYDKTWIFDGDVLKYKSTQKETETDGCYYNITSLETTDKGALNVSGLDAKVEYTIVETVAPEKYARISPFTVNLDPAIGTDDDYNGKLATGTKVTPEVETDKSFDFEHYVQLLDPKSGSDADDDGSANMLVANFKYVDLPSTGGVGTYLFYILGAGGLAISFLLFKMSRKKAVN